MSNSLNSRSEASHIKTPPLVSKAVTEAQQHLTPYFLPFLVQIFRTTHPHEFFPRRWLESAQIMGVIKGFANDSARQLGVKKETDEKQVYLHVLGVVFEWPIPSLTRYLEDSGVSQLRAFANGLELAKNVISEKGLRAKVHELTLIRLIDDEHHRIADELKKTLTNPVLKSTFQAKDFQIAKGW